MYRGDWGGRLYPYRLGGSDLVTSVGPGADATAPLAIEQVESVIEATPSSLQSQESGAPVANKVNGVYIRAPKKKHAPPTKLKGIAICVPAVLTTLISEDREDDIIPPLSACL